MAKLQYYGTGRRKSAVARVRLFPGTGKITINKKDIDDYFGLEILKREVRRPFDIAGVAGQFDIIATVNGGGTTGQAGAMRSKYRVERTFEICRLPDKRPKNEGKKEIRTEESKKSIAVLKEIILKSYQQLRCSHARSCCFI